MKVYANGVCRSRALVFCFVDPSLIGDIDRTEQLIIQAAASYTGSRDVGCFTGDVPNAAYGYGVLDVYEAVQEALNP